MQTKLVLFAMMFFLAGLAGQAGAQVLRWTDKNGRVHYGDDPAPAARNVREVTAPVNTLDMSGLRRVAAEPAPAASSSSSANTARPAGNANARPAASYPRCRRRG